MVTLIGGLVDITIGSLDDPAAIQPTLHYWYSKHLSWFGCEDGLPKYEEFRPPRSNEFGRAS
jgi:hypothetical protein